MAPHSAAFKGERGQLLSPLQSPNGRVCGRRRVLRRRGWSRDSAGRLLDVKEGSPLTQEASSGPGGVL